MAGQIAVGADRLHSMEPKLSGKRVGLLTNPTGVNRQFVTTVEQCAALPSGRLAALFACEHGLRGEFQAGERFEDAVHPELNIPVYSLYGTRKKPEAEMLKDIDIVLFDIQDTGNRFYTYLSTMVYLMEACAEAGKELIVLDRPNPLGGWRVEGSLLRPGYESMVGAVAGTPYATGMTIGEYALWVNDRLPKSCHLSVVPMEGWDRRMEYDQTGLPWMLPSPNMPSLNTVRVYAGTCLFEGTNVSEGRGTTLPFEMIGAPWINAEQLAKELRALSLPGVHAQPVYYTPTFSKHQGTLCGGVRLFVTGPEAFRAVETGLTLLDTIAKLYPESFEWLPPVREGGRSFIDLLSGGDEVRMLLGTGNGLQSLKEAYLEAELQWKEARKPYLLYS
ncbi:DUF1343 domain-containing protein [Paenibacillus sp. GD4]|uniref:exo-beta-N-acetylmuramidase NamZ family protein n=1 Tax=Paenibacillus sp. GD4 TaxID=3068890 RepID=UPI00279674D7|nr:DUF1343 domain-containing protein [Paenibacillus sp. GD4]MDQ1910440.1 DUF1343 domain-containing protein [Paenibacillus sp. GD4]